MRRLAIVSCFLFVATPGEAQISTQTLTLAGVSDCIAEAIATNAVDGSGFAVTFSCTAAKARTLYNFLGRKIRIEVVQDRNGKFENRAFESGACYHRVEDRDGKTADEFRCDLIIAIGEVRAE
jgi:hypothetical protein